MTYDELVASVKELMPDAIFDKTYRTGEIVISTGLTMNGKEVVSLDHEFLN